MICFNWGRGENHRRDVHGPTLAVDAHDKNFKLAKEINCLASLWLLCHGQLQFTVINKALKTTGCRFQRSLGLHRGEAIHCRWGEGKAFPSLLTDVDWNSTGFCFIQWRILIHRPGLSERYNATLYWNDIWVRICYWFLSLLNVNTNMLHFIVMLLHFSCISKCVITKFWNHGHL